MRVKLDVDKAWLVDKGLQALFVLLIDDFLKSSILKDSLVGYLVVTQSRVDKACEAAISDEALPINATDLAFLFRFV